MYPLIQNVAKFRSKCEKYQINFCPELHPFSEISGLVSNWSDAIDNVT